MIALDNDILAKIGGQDPDQTVLSHLKQYSNREWTIPALVAWEFYKSQTSRTQMLKSQRILNKEIDRVLDFSDDVALEAAYLGQRLETQGVALKPVDMLNLATAHEAGATFVTHNSNDFDKPPIHELTDIDVVVS